MKENQMKKERKVEIPYQMNIIERGRKNKIKEKKKKSRER